MRNLSWVPVVACASSLAESNGFPPYSKPGCLRSSALLPGMRKMLRKGSLTVEFAGGEKYKFGDGSGVSVQVYVRAGLTSCFVLIKGCLQKRRPWKGSSKQL